MKILKMLIVPLILIVFGYALGIFFPLIKDPQLISKISGFIMPPESIEGEAVLQVELLIDNGSPLGRIEVDLAEESGPPPEGGISVTDDNGLATFHVKPGSYFVYFNNSNFPENLQIPEPKQVEIKDDNTNLVTIIVEVL